MIQLLSSKKYFFAVFVLISVAAFFSVGYHHADEHFQILEFAALKLKLTQPADLAWEYHFQMRPALQPALTVLVYKLVHFFYEENNFITVIILKWLSGLLTFTGIFLLYKVFKKELTTNYSLINIFLLSSCFAWFFYYCGIRYSSETWSGGFFIIGFCCYFLLQQKVIIKFILIGLCFGFSIVFRFQSIALVSGFLLWLMIIKKEKLTTLLYITIGALLIYALGIIIDRWFYGKWVFTVFNYFYQNIILHKAENFGKQGVLFYFIETFIRGIPPISILIICSVILFFIYFPKHSITWSIFPFILVHFILTHKELRFLFPVIGFLPVMFVLVLQRTNMLERKSTQFFLKICWIINLLLLTITIFKKLNVHEPLYKHIFYTYKEKSILYCLDPDENPYVKVGLKVSFFMPKNLTIKKINSISEAKSVKGYTCLFVTKNRMKYEDSLFNKKMVYASFPDWVFKFNFNHWIERSDCYYLYELN